MSPEEEVKKYMAEAVPSGNVDLFWRVAKERYPEEVAELNKMRSQFLAEQYVSPRTWTVKRYVHVAKELIRKTAIQMIWTKK